MYIVFFFLIWGGGIEISFTPQPPTLKNLLGGVLKNDVTEMIHILTFQSINNVLYFFKLGGGGIYTPTPYTIKNCFTNSIQNILFM